MMKPLPSAYLDAMPFFAALVVFLGHGSGKYWTGGFPWQLENFNDLEIIALTEKEHIH